MLSSRRKPIAHRFQSWWFLLIIATFWVRLQAVHSLSLSLYRHQHQHRVALLLVPSLQQHFNTINSKIQADSACKRVTMLWSTLDGSYDDEDDDDNGGNVIGNRANDMVGSIQEPISSPPKWSRVLRISTMASHLPSPLRTVFGKARWSIRMMPIRLVKEQHQRQHNEMTTTTTLSARHRHGRFRRRLGRYNRWVMAIAGALAAWQFRTTPDAVSAAASAPIMLIPKHEQVDIIDSYLEDVQRKVQNREMDEMTAEKQRGIEIEKTQGEAARRKYEQECEIARVQRREEYQQGYRALKIKLLKQGICPYTDMEGRRQLIKYELGVDVAGLPGTMFNYEYNLEQTNYKKSMAYKKATNRQIIACIAQDLTNRGVDLIDYFEKHQQQSEEILELSKKKATELLEAYQANLELYGQITIPAPGEMSALEKMKLSAEQEAAARAASSSGSSKAEERRLKAEAKAAAKAEQQRIKAEAAKAKEAAKQAAKLATARAKAAAQQEVAAALSAASAAISADASATLRAATSSPDTVESPLLEQSVTDEMADDFPDGEVDQDDPSTDGFAVISAPPGPQPLLPVPAEHSSSSAVKPFKTIPIVPAASVLVAAGGGAYAIKFALDRRAKDEQERQRQLRLLMQGAGGEGTTTTKSKSNSKSASDTVETEEEDEVDNDEVDEEVEDDDDDDSVVTPMESKTSTPKAAKKIEPPQSDVTTEDTRKRRTGGGLKGVFGRKKNTRETDINVLLAEESVAQEFTILLSKILTFGAPGRFPNIVAHPGGMPMKEFDLEEAKDMLIKSRQSAGLTLEESAEAFANVVNCMVVDIVDLASASLKEKDDKLLVDAMDIVVDFMNHAASLYDSVAEGYIIKPVTYGGTLSKSKLEQMFSTYGASGMMNMDRLTDGFDDRLTLLQDVFEINPKKAEGLMTKAMQRSMMKAIKTGEGLEGMEEMMKSMGGLADGGLPGMMDGEGPSVDYLRETLLSLKQLKDAGSIPPDELNSLKQQLRQHLGSNLDEAFHDASSDADALSSQEKELLQLMKEILEV